jgi:hypothetical protein
MSADQLGPSAPVPGGRGRRILRWTLRWTRRRFRAPVRLSSLDHHDPG